MDPLNQNPTSTPQPVTPVPVTPAPTETPIQQPTMNAAPANFAVPPKKTSWGAVIGIIIILALLVIAALYFWGKSQLEDQLGAEDTPSGFQQASTEPITDSELQIVDSLEADINGIELDSTAEIDALAQ